MIVELHKVEQHCITGNAKERGDVRGNPIKEMLSQSAMSVDQKPPIGKENPIKELLSLRVMSLDQKPRADKGDPIKEIKVLRSSPRSTVNPVSTRCTET